MKNCKTHGFWHVITFGEQKGVSCHNAPAKKNHRLSFYFYIQWNSQNTKKGIQRNIKTVSAFIDRVVTTTGNIQIFC